MSLTIGLVREMEFLSTYAKKPVHFTFHLVSDLEIKINNKILDLSYNNIPIWKENISIDGMFGLESVSHIYKIINLIDNGEEYGKYCYFE